MVEALKDKGTSEVLKKLREMRKSAQDKKIAGICGAGERGQASVIRYYGDTLLISFDKSCGRCLPSINEREVFDPKDLYDPDSSGETFCVLKEKEEREYGE
jgi:hypothetical protein